MSGVLRAEIRDLAFHPRIRILPLDVRAHRRNQVAHRPDAPLRWPKTEPQLIDRAHTASVTQPYCCSSRDARVNLPGIADSLPRDMLPPCSIVRRVDARLRRSRYRQ